MSKLFLPTWFICISLFIVVVVPGKASATIYTFVDEAGVVHFSNVPDDSRYKPVYGGQKSYGPHYDSIIKRAAAKFELDPLLIKAVIKAESDFDRWAVSSKGAKGLMQLMPETISDMNVRDPFEPADNIFGGARYLKKLINRFNGNLKLVLAAYNAGPERVEKLGRVPHIKETKNYVKKVIKHYEKYLAQVPRKGWMKVS